MLAELLDLPQVTAVTRIELLDGAEAILHRKLSRGDIEVIKCPLPALFAVAPEINTPRYPSLRRVLDSQKSPIEKPELANRIPGFDTTDKFSSLTKVITMSAPRPKPRKTVTLDTLTSDTSLSAEDRLNLVQSYGMTQSDGDLWQGSPQELAKRVVNFIKKEGFLSL
jgi:electron transfer flavoprotein beta subunit